MKRINDLPDFNKMAKTILDSASDESVNKGLAFFKAGFRKGGFTDRSFDAWERKRNDGDPGRLLTKSGRLMDSLKVMERSSSKIVIGTDLPYAAIHNTGGVITIAVTSKSRKYFWAMYYKTRRGFWRGLALTKKTEIRLRIPKRQFLGHSDNLMNSLLKAIDLKIERL